jgi:hypothetical protein
MKLVYDDRAELRRRLVVCDGEAGMEASESNDFAIQLCDDDSVRAARREALQPPANVVRRGRVSKLPNQGCESSCVTRTRIADCDLHRCEECRKQTLRRPGAHGTRYPRCVRQHAGVTPPKRAQSMTAAGRRLMPHSGLLVAAASDLRRVRSSIIDVVSHDLLLDLTVGAETFWSRTELSFRCRREGARAFADLRPVEVQRVVLNGADVTGHHLHRDGRLELPNLARENTLAVEAEFAYVEIDTGLYRFGGGKDGGGGERGFGCVYSNANRGGAAGIFCCFDQPDLRAPITLAARAPAGWCCRANSPMSCRPADGDEGVWRFMPTPPLAPYQFAFCASPEPVAVLGAVVDRDPPVMLAVWTPAASSDPFDEDMLIELVRRPLHYYADALGVP